MFKHSYLLLFFGITSCGIYRQNAINAPLMEHKGQAQLGGHIHFNGLEAQAAYALTNKIAVLANYSDMGVRKEEYSANNYSTWAHNFKEIGAGIFRKNKSGNIREFFAFAGNGMTKHFVMGKNSTGAFSSTSQEVKYSRFLVQADFGNRSKTFQYILSPRLLAVNYYNVIDNSRTDYKDLSHFRLYGEAAATIRYPIWKFLMISGQLGATLPLTPSAGNDYYEFSPFNASVGVIFNINLLKDK